MYKVPGETEQAVRFQFPVRWSTLLDPAALVPPGDSARIVTPRNTPSDPSVQWAMVIPKLEPVSAAPRLLPAVESGWAATFAAPKYVIPKFEVSSGSSSLAVKLLLAMSVVLLLVPGWRNTASPGARAVEIESTMGESGWVRESAGPTRQLVLYRASIAAGAPLGASYRLDFTWRIAPQGVACVFRATDSNNYYAIRIKPIGAETSRALSLERFAVIRGVERSRSQRTLVLPSKNASKHVALDVASSTFRLYLDGTLVSQWTDSRLTKGGIGFLEESGHRPELQSVRISFPQR